MPTVKRKTAKSWRHPLRKPTARAVPSAVKQQATSDDGKYVTYNRDAACPIFTAYLRRGCHCRKVIKDQV